MNNPSYTRFDNSSQQSEERLPDRAGRPRASPASRDGRMGWSARSLRRLRIQPYHSYPFGIRRSGCARVSFSRPVSLRSSPSMSLRSRSAPPCSLRQLAPRFFDQPPDVPVPLDFCLEVLSKSWHMAPCERFHTGFHRFAHGVDSCLGIFRPERTQRGPHEAVTALRVLCPSGEERVHVVYDVSTFRFHLFPSPACHRASSTSSTIVVSEVISIVPPRTTT